MAVADVAFLIIVLGLLGIGGKTLFASFKQAGENRRLKREDEKKLRDDLREALASHKRQKLEDFLVLWGDKLPKEVHAHVKQRIDELLIEE